MIARFSATTALLAAGSALAGALYWALINTPDSNAWMLLVSSVLTLGGVAVIATTINAAILQARGTPLREAVARGLRSIGRFVLAVTPLMITWWGLIASHDWVIAHQSEINAWFIVRFGWADISPLLDAELWICRWLFWAAAPIAALSWLAALLTTGAGGPRPFRNLLHWRKLLVSTLAFAVVATLTPVVVEWRPALPPTWIEPAVAGVRLAVAFLLGVLGGAVMITVSAAPGRIEQQHD